jgi:hypothetical protein
MPATLSRDGPGPRRFELQLAGRARSAAKEEKVMSEEKVLCSHELVIRFDQLEGNRVNWYVLPDDTIRETIELSLIDLAECNAPLACSRAW